MKKFLFLLFLFSSLIACGPSESSEESAPPRRAQGTQPANPPVNIGDGSPISFDHWNGVRKGSGKLKVGSLTSEVELLELDLKADGTFMANLSGPKLPKETYRGRWKKKDDRAVKVAVTEDPHGLPVASHGSLQFMDQANPSKLEIGGTVKGGDTFSVNFRVSE